MFAEDDQQRPDPSRVNHVLAAVFLPTISQPLARLQVEECRLKIVNSQLSLWIDLSA